MVGIGRLTPQKDFASLLRSFQLVRKERDCRLVILGEGPERDALLHLADELGIREHVDLPGFVPNPYAVLARAQAFVLSSRWEGLPTVLIEAMALGVPLVAADCPSGPREILQDGAFGELVPVGDVEAMARAIVAALHQDPDAARGAARAEPYLFATAARTYLKLARQDTSS